MQLLGSFLGTLGTYALPIIVVVLVLTVIGALKGWVMGIGEFWGVAGLLAVFLILGIFALWAGQALVGEILLAVGITGLFIDLYAVHRKGE